MCLVNVDVSISSTGFYYTPMADSWSGETEKPEATMTPGTNPKLSLPIFEEDVTTAVLLKFIRGDRVREAGVYP
jgi:hypothetical protein